MAIYDEQDGMSKGKYDQPSGDALIDTVESGEEVTQPNGRDADASLADGTEEFREFTARIHPCASVPEPLVVAGMALEDTLGLPVWFLVSPIEPWLVRSFLLYRDELPQSPIALVIDSPGGDAHAAYQIARLLHDRCGEYVAVVPRYAKSAATLLALGSREIILGSIGELGPLDA